MTYVFITFNCYPLPIAKHLQDEGYDVIVAVVERYADLKLPGSKDDEEPKDRKERLSNYDGILDKITLPQVMEALKKVPVLSRDDYFFFFDVGDMYVIAEQVLKMGFTNGLFPTEKYYRLEKERELSKAFVKKHYPKVKVADSFTFSKIEEGIKHIEQSEDIFALKSNGNSGKTVVPKSDDVDVARGQLIAALEKGKKDYERGGFMLEKKILGALEITPVMVFYDGEPVYTLVEFENKPIGAGNIGVQKGGVQCLTVRTDINAEINKIAFPPVIYKMAKQHPGLSIFDAGLLYDGENFWFTEFCGQRYGWDGIFAEMVMRDDGGQFVADYFEDVMAGINPLKNKYGVSVRLFNYEGDMEQSYSPKADEPMTWDSSIDDYLFVYNVKFKDDEIVTTGDNDFIAAVCAAGNNLSDTVAKAYERVNKFNFEKLYYRYEADFMDKSYPTSILSRLAHLKEFLEVKE